MELTRLAQRIFDLLDTYEVMDTDTTPETIMDDLINRPYDVLSWLVEMLETIND